MNGNRTSCLVEPTITPTQPQTNPPPRILVVEDDPAILQLSTSVLSLSGYEVDAATNGAVAWQALNTKIYDLMITDNNMPELSGVELLQKLRAAGMVLPVILATGLPPTEEFARQPWLKPAATLLKPFTFEQMLRTVENLLRATDHPGAQPEPLPSWRSQLLAEGLTR
jgi:DNA-binding response OmpR family regulator